MIEGLAVQARQKRGKKSGLFVMREPSGRLSRAEPMTIEDCSPSQVKRLRDAAMKLMCDPEWGTELGRLFLAGKITAAQFSAGKWFALLSVACREAIDAPSPPSKTAFVERAGGHSADPDSDKGRKQAERDRAAVQSFMEVHAALLGAGMLSERAVRLVCEDNQTIDSHYRLMHLRSGLEWISEYRRLTSLTKNGNSLK